MLLDMLKENDAPTSWPGCQCVLRTPATCLRHLLKAVHEEDDAVAGCAWRRRHEVQLELRPSIHFIRPDQAFLDPAAIRYHKPSLARNLALAESQGHMHTCSVTCSEMHAMPIDLSHQGSAFELLAATTYLCVERLRGAGNAPQYRLWRI